jgi:small subunit ribosomal protein S17
MRTKIGVVTSAKMQKTVAVTVHRYVMHPTYGKRFRRSKKFLADTNGFDIGEGDQVVISECRPLSKNKCFIVTEIKKQAPRLEDFKSEELEESVKRDHRDASYDKKEAKEKAKKKDTPSPITK